MMVEAPQHRGGIADEASDRSTDAIELGSGSMSILMIVSLSSCPGRRWQEPRADRQHHVGLGPQRVPAGQHVASAWRCRARPCRGDSRRPARSRRSASARTSAAASRAPPPTKITGHSAFASRPRHARSRPRRARARSGGSGPPARYQPRRRVYPAASRARPGAGVRLQLLERLGARPVAACGRLDAVGPFGQRAQDGGLVGISCRKPRPLPIERLGIWPISASTWAPVE